MKMEIEMRRQREDETAQEIKSADTVAGDTIDRRNFLGCMAWAGTGLLWTMVGGVPTSRLLAADMKGRVRRSEGDRGFLVRADQRQPYRLQ